MTGPLAYLPTAVLAAVVFMIGKDLIDVKEMRQIFMQRRSEFWVAAITAAVVFFVGVEQGIATAIVLSLLDHTRRGYKPKNELLSIDQIGNKQLVPVSSRTQFLPGLIIYRFNHSMYYANMNLFSEEVLDLISRSEPRLSWFCLDATAVDDVDFSAAAMLRETYATLIQHGIRFVLVAVASTVLAEMDRYGLTDLMGKDSFFGTVHELESAYESRNTVT
jgi:MFS superfamily sulfate permease-like transporter